MKSLIVFLLFGLIFIQAEALQCRKSSCVGTRPCSHFIDTCEKDATLCFVTLKTKPILILTRGCVTEANCKMMQAFDSSVRCCSTNLCN
ncbi:hypothetical protein GDO86_007273 [Hymenochirus boettgeri]|uniref:Uncharacterized protein n=1 Tax=Hymenochirus boettgeri TaxID=247094 RepID=A0A8T2J095_9PIPI|nr:hypothetical protein GDO86_007273 [Hymenochirus boettgeri]